MKPNLLIAIPLLLITTVAGAASPDFQDFLTRACASAPAGTDFFTRCNVDSVDGDLSGDSEDSLNPTQSLANASSAIAETRARIKALREQVGKQDHQPSQDSDVKETFRQSGYSLILNGEDGSIDRDASVLERGFATDSTRLQIGFDYRAGNNFIWGAVLSAEQFDTVYDADQPGTNFAPGPSEGDSERDSLSLSLFAATNLTEKIYVDALVSIARSDFTFRRISIFQESSRTLPTRPIVTLGDTEGDELAISLGLSYDASFDAFSVQSYLRGNFQQSSIDPYSEQGGDGFAMFITNNRLTEFNVLAGLRLQRAVNTSFGVLVPQAFVEYEANVDQDDKISRQRFLADPTATTFTVVGDSGDSSYGRAGIGVVAVFANGFSAFITTDIGWGRDLIDETRINAGLRREF